MPSVRLLLCLAGILGVARAQLSLPVGSGSDAITKDLSELQATYLPASYAKSNLTLADVKRLLRHKCHKANAALPNLNATELSERIEQAGLRLMQCSSDLVNITQVLDEIEQARPRGELDVVFEKYCLRMPQAKTCLVDFNEALLPCMTREERAQNAVMMRIVNRLLEFVCYKNGDQIALFIAEEGPECLEQNKDHIAKCMNSTFSGYLPQQLNEKQLEQVELPELVLGPRQCIDLHDFESCVVGYLEKCNTITPANIVESLFRYVRKESKCQTEIDRVVKERATAQRLTADPLFGAAASVRWSIASIGPLALAIALTARTALSI